MERTKPSPNRIKPGDTVLFKNSKGTVRDIYGKGANRLVYIDIGVLYSLSAVQELDLKRVNNKPMERTKKRWI